MPRTSSKRISASADIASIKSWDFSTWPGDVWPNEAGRARWVVRSHRDELVAAGALARSGKTLIVLARGYERWLISRAGFVREFESNNPRLRSCRHVAAASA